jgi:hypothetical protein
VEIMFCWCEHTVRKNKFLFTFQTLKFSNNATNENPKITDNVISSWPHPSSFIQPPFLSGKFKFLHREEKKERIMKPRESRGVSPYLPRASQSILSRSGQWSQPIRRSLSSVYWGPAGQALALPPPPLMELRGSANSHQLTPNHRRD